MSATLTQKVRTRMRLNPELGAGNFVHHAYAANPRRDTPIVHFDRDVQLLGKTTRALSLGELKDATDRIAAWYLSRGIEPMDPVAVYCDDGPHYLIQYAALTAIGAIPVLTNGGLTPDIAARHFRRIETVGVVADPARLESIDRAAGRDGFQVFAAVDDVKGCDPSSLPSWYPYRHDPQDPVMITHSSGTTGIPKAVTLGHRGWFHGIRHLLGLEAAAGADRYLSSLPASHNAAIA
ncbi:MAG: acyl--CoA ligase, partial [Gemmatimonadetes bacterium]|nr:acyl--CoA ligase [Gemmatimonadota bacterium]